MAQTTSTEDAAAPGAAPGQTGGANGASAESAGGSAKLPLIAGATAAAAITGWVVVAGRAARRTVLGVKVPRRGTRSTGDVLRDGAREVGRTVGGLPGIAAVRDRIGR